MKRILAALLAVSFLLLASCGGESSRYSRDRISETLGLDVSAASSVTVTDTHEGIHGDGEAYAVLTFDDDTLLEQLAGNQAWKPLPLSQTLTAVVYGIRTDTVSSGPYISFSDDGAAAVPKIENGYYWFCDRHSTSTDPADDSLVLKRASFNLTVVIFDADTNTLHYLELDT